MYFAGQEFSGAAKKKRPDTPLLNFAATHSARPGRSLPAFAVNK
jgi:hypothetical protein